MRMRRMSGKGPLRRYSSFDTFEAPNLRRHVAAGTETPVTGAYYQIRFSQGFSRYAAVSWRAPLSYVSRIHLWKHI
jgi:hypothetical protein